MGAGTHGRGTRLVATDPGGVGQDTVGFHRLLEDGAVGEALARVQGKLSIAV